MDPLGGIQLPREQIARYPVHPRDHSRLLTVQREENSLGDHRFYNLENFLEKGDLMVFNNTKVFSARVFLESEATGKRHECIFLRRDQMRQGFWEVMIKGSKHLSDGERLMTTCQNKFAFQFFRFPDDQLRLKEPFTLNPEDFDKFGETPIPPYLKRDVVSSDRKDYQSIFAQEYGSAASPTASLHFTQKLTEKIRAKGVRIEPVTLHIGYGTFAPLRKQNFTEKKLHAEWYSIPEKTAGILGAKDHSRLIVVGTTTLRVLETVHQKTQGRFDHSLSGETDLFLLPPDKVQTADALITNFHLPDSSLIYLVACMMPPSLLRRAYAHAISEKYRFYSYGDAMLIL